MIDAFMAWDAEYTLRFLDAAGTLGLHWIEDPLPPHDLEGLRRIKSERGRDVTLAMGNFAFNRWDCAELMREGLVDILQPDVAWSGGITENLRILAQARQARLPVILHNTCEQPWALALAAACQTDAVVEFVDRGDQSPMYELMGPRARVERGWVCAPDDPVGNRPPAQVQSEFGRSDRSLRTSKEE
jgi:L-rhamnonate dehydratase